VGGQRRKKGSRVTPKGGAPIGRLTPDERAGLEEIFEGILRTASKDLTDDLPPVAVEMWASQMWSIWAKSELVGMDAIEVFAGGLITYAGKRATPGALMVLRALGAIAPASYGQRARRAADRLVAEGLRERRWAAVVGTWEPTAAWLSYDPADDDGVNVLVGFHGAQTTSTVGVYVDHNLGAMAKDAFVVPAGIDQVLAELQKSHAGDDEPSYREITLEEAAARWRQALAMTDMYLDPPSSEDIDHLRALVMARLATLPHGGEVPSSVQIGEDDRDSLLSEFLDSDETVGLWGTGGDDDEDETVEQLSHQILTFALDYVVGTPLRFSPVMVEMFCLDWAPRKIAMDGDAFTLLPDVLAAWIRFAGRRRGLPESSIRKAVEAVYEYAPEMIELSQDPEVWGPAKIMALAIQQRGVDLTDQKALDDFVAEVNRQGGIDVLADSLAGSVAPKR
jgi:hypothetical protein